MTHRAVEAVMMQRQGQFAVLEAVAAFCEDASDFASVRTASEDGCDGDTCRERHPEGSSINDVTIFKGWGEGIKSKSDDHRLHNK